LSALVAAWDPPCFPGLELWKRLELDRLFEQALDGNPADVSDGNLAAIRKRGGQYLVGTPRSQMEQLEAELVKDDWAQVRPEVEIRKVSVPWGEET
jgi:hypothetical protein